jgi:hypothetical protein
VEVHTDDWWIRKFESYGFHYDAQLTDQVRLWAKNGFLNKTADLAPNGEPWSAYYLRVSLKVFVNPAVASLPEHAHLFPEHGCFGGRDSEGKMIHRECGAVQRGDAVESPLEPSMYPIELTAEMDEAWLALIKKNVNFEAIGW